MSDDFQGRWHFNTCIAAIMELVNELYAVEGQVARASSPAGPIPAPCCAEVQRILALLLAPFAPYLAHELWEMLGEKGSLLRAPWPKYDPALAKEEEIEIPGADQRQAAQPRRSCPADAPEKAVEQRALADEKIQAHACRQAES